jgi:hypothetical protein
MEVEKLMNFYKGIKFKVPDGRTLAGATLRTASEGSRIEQDSVDGIRGIDDEEEIRWQAKVDGKLYVDTLHDIAGDTRLDFLSSGVSIEYGSSANKVYIVTGADPIEIYAHDSLLTACDLYLSAYNPGDALILGVNHCNTEIARIDSDGLTIHGNADVGLKLPDGGKIQINSVDILSATELALGGNTIINADGVNLPSGDVYKINDVQVLGAQQAAESDAGAISWAGVPGGTDGVDLTQLQINMAALVTTIQNMRTTLNNFLAKARTLGFIASE